ncbi:hypothetical protein DVS28_b0060 (plasmid) [Euzebya pacifica]|uniref:Uncharacterized protein n=1 Tax=Euzebya pacifica TaxID=1608957 RepID=A0A346Y5T3_9ACTN|nr:hypothetical protein [Euzebya pacifica]AXV09830.1 hypothetical protein DVS28_b0060 [Euzebya pacifica]
MPTIIPTPLAIVGPQIGHVAFMLAIRDHATLTNLAYRLEQALGPMEADGTIGAHRVLYADPRDLTGDNGTLATHPTDWTLVRVEADTTNVDTIMAVEQRMAAFLAREDDGVCFGWTEDPLTTDDFLLSRLFEHLDAHDADGDPADGWYWILHALIRRLTPHTGIVTSAEPAPGRSWAAEDDLLARFADTFIAASDTAGRSAAADHAFLSGHCTRYRRATRSGGLDQLGRAQGRDLIDTFSPTLTGGARTAAINALATLTSRPKREVGSAVTDRALDRLEATPRATDVRLVAQGLAGTHQIGSAHGPNRSLPIGKAILAALAMRDADLRGPMRRRTCTTVIDDNDPTRRTWHVSVDTADGRVLTVDGFEPDRIRIQQPAGGSAPSTVEPVGPSRNGTLVGIVDALHRIAVHR